MSTELWLTGATVRAIVAVPSTRTLA